MMIVIVSQYTNIHSDFINTPKQVYFPAFKVLIPVSLTHLFIT